MKINKINLAMNNQNAFKGLWGREKTNSYYDSLGDYYDVEKYYYPFADETRKDIQEIVKINSKYYATNSDDIIAAKKFVAEPVMHYEQTVVKIMEKLPFTKGEYQKFQQNKLSELKTSVIKHCLDFIEKAHK